MTHERDDTSTAERQQRRDDGRTRGAAPAVANPGAVENPMSKIDDAADNVKKGTDKAADAAKDAAKNAGEKIENAGDKIKKEGR